MDNNTSDPKFLDQDDLLNPHKKHKKHKHKKHKKKKELDEGLSSSFLDSNAIGKPSLKLKIKIGGQTLGEKSVTKKEVAEDSSEESMIDEEAEQDEEDAWLDALESGRLEEVDDELKKMKDPTLMTVRQKALLESKSQKDKDEAVPVIKQETTEMTEEMIQRRLIRAKKRKEQADEKREKDKKETLEKLLKKGDQKPKTSSKKSSGKTDEKNRICYINNSSGVILHYPEGYEFPLKPQVVCYPLPKTLCSIDGCKHHKKYNHSKLGKPLCSIECYRKLELLFARQLRAIEKLREKENKPSHSDIIEI